MIPFWCACCTVWQTATRECVGEPGPGERPVPVGGPAGDAQGVGRVAQRHSGEEPKLHQFGGCGELVRQQVEGAVEFQEVVVGRGGRAGESVEIDPVASAVPPQPVAVAGAVDQHPPHRLGRGGEEVPSAVEELVADQR